MKSFKQFISEQSEQPVIQSVSLDPDPDPKPTDDDGEINCDELMQELIEKFEGMEQCEAELHKWEMKWLEIGIKLDECTRGCRDTFGRPDQLMDLIACFKGCNRDPDYGEDALHHAMKMVHAIRAICAEWRLEFDELWEQYQAQCGDVVDKSIKPDSKLKQPSITSAQTPDGAVNVRI